MFTNIILNTDSFHIFHHNAWNIVFAEKISGGCDTLQVIKTCGDLCFLQCILLAGKGAAVIHLQSNRNSKRKVLSFICGGKATASQFFQYFVSFPDNVSRPE